MTPDNSTHCEHEFAAQMAGFADTMRLGRLGLSLIHISTRSLVKRRRFAYLPGEGALPDKNLDLDRVSRILRFVPTSERIDRSAATSNMSSPDGNLLSPGVVPPITRGHRAAADGLALR